MTGEKCYYCDQKAVTKCEKCHLVGFCEDIDHKKLHFNVQTDTCLPFKVCIKYTRVLICGLIHKPCEHERGQGFAKCLIRKWRAKMEKLFLYVILIFFFEFALHINMKKLPNCIYI